MTSVPALSCREVVELVTDFLEGTLAPEVAAAFERHLEICSGCARYVEQFRVTIDTVGEIRSEGLSPETQAGLLEAFRTFRRPTV